MKYSCRFKCFKLKHRLCAFFILICIGIYANQTEGVNLSAALSYLQIPLSSLPKKNGRMPYLRLSLAKFMIRKPPIFYIFRQYAV